MLAVLMRPNGEQIDNTHPPNVLYLRLTIGVYGPKRQKHVNKYLTHWKNLGFS